MASRIEIINDALVSTGNNDCAEFDGSDEWRHGEAAYRRSVGFLLNRHRWGFAKQQWPLTNLVTAASARYEFSYAKPNDVLHVEGLLVNELPLVEYEIVDDKICCEYDSGVVLRGVRVPPMSQWPLHWIELLTMRCEGCIYESLNEDQSGAAQKIGAVERYLQEIKTAADQEEPRRHVLVSRVALRRRSGSWRG